MQEDAVLMVVSDKEKVLRKEDLEIFSTIRRITAKGNDVVVKRRKDGSLVAYEINPINCTKEIFRDKMVGKKKRNLFFGD